jgi:hypothetical protein
MERLTLTHVYCKSSGMEVNFVFNFIGIRQFLLLRNQRAGVKTMNPMLLLFKIVSFGIRYRFIQMNFTLLGRNLVEA